MFSALNEANFDFLWLRVMTPWRVKMTSFFWTKWKLAFTHLHDGNYGNINETWLASLEQRSIMMTWLDSWQFVITWHTWHTWHDVKAWLHEHKVLYLTSSIYRCEWTEAMILLLFHTVSMSWNSFQLFADCETFTRDLESEGHVRDYVTLVISTCIRPTAMIFSLFRKVFRSRNSFQLLPTGNCVNLTRDLESEGYVMD